MSYKSLVACLQDSSETRLHKGPLASPRECSNNEMGKMAEILRSKDWFYRFYRFDGFDRFYRFNRFYRFDSKIQRKGRGGGGGGTPTFMDRYGHTHIHVLIHWDSAKGLTKRVRVLLIILSPSAHCLLFSWRHRVTTMNDWRVIVISRPQAVWQLNSLKIIPPVPSCSTQLLLDSVSHSRPSYCVDFIFIRTDIVLLFEDKVYFFHRGHSLHSNKYFTCIGRFVNTGMRKP